MDKESATVTIEYNEGAEKMVREFIADYFAIPGRGTYKIVPVGENLFSLTTSQVNATGLMVDLGFEMRDLIKLFKSSQEIDGGLEKQ